MKSPGCQRAILVQVAAVTGRCWPCSPAGWQAAIFPAGPRPVTGMSRPESEQDVQRPVPAELRRLPWGGWQAGPGTAAERQVVPGPDTGRRVAACHRGRPTGHADAGICRGHGRTIDGRAGRDPGGRHQAALGTG